MAKDNHFVLLMGSVGMAGTCFCSSMSGASAGKAYMASGASTPRKHLKVSSLTYSSDRDDSKVPLAGAERRGHLHVALACSLGILPAW